MPSQRRVFIYLFRVAVLCAAYFGMAKLGLELAYSAKQITLIWPPAGIALASLLIWGFPLWPGIFLGAFAVNFSVSGFFFSSFGIAASNTAAALAGVFLLRKIKGFNQTFVRMSDYTWFVLLGAVIPTLISAFLGTSNLILSGAISAASAKDFFLFFRTWWIGDLTGVIIFAPVFLVWPHILDIARNRRRLMEVLIFLSVCLDASLFLFNPATHYFTVTLLPLTLWAIVRFYQSGVVFMTLFCLIVSIFGTIGGFGLFAHIGSPQENLLFAQIFLSIISAGSMLVALSAFEGKKSVEEWKKLSLALHEKISEQAEKLAARAQELQEYIDHTSIFTAKVGIDGTILVSSKSAKAASGISNKELLKTNFLEGPWWSFDPEVQARVRNAFRRAVSGETIRYDEQILAFGTTRIWISLGLIPVPGKNGKTAFIIAEGVDVTERKKLENSLVESQYELEKKVAQRTSELHDANMSLKEEVALRDRFLATLSHELRNPLSPIINAVEIIRMMNIEDEETRKLFEIIERQANQMARLLKDLMDVSRIAHQKINLEIGQVEIADVMKAAIETTRPWFLNEKHELSVSLPVEPLVVEGDALRLEQILINILNNASKYTPEGGRIFLSARSENRKAVITVRDNGVGISPRMLPKVFDLFSQDKKSNNMAKGGLGIGLALSKALTELHGGNITVSSEGQGKGSVFEVILPLKQTELVAKK